MSGPESWVLKDSENLWVDPEILSISASKEIPLLAMLRVRNEELILADTLNHLSDFADVIVAYEDSSSDHTRQILRSHPKVGLIIENNQWEPLIDDRLLAETRHRGLLLQEAQKHWNFRWCMCCDADERYIGDIRGLVTHRDQSSLPDSIRISLFDAYMTPNDKEPYRPGEKLLNFRRYFGPECRNILMLWKNRPDAFYQGLDAREPCVPGTSANKFQCQHYGKSLSIEHWEDTCEYYVKHFPYVPYGKKWQDRKGKSIHTMSDFGRRLFEWGPDLFNNKVVEF